MAIDTTRKFIHPLKGFVFHPAECLAISSPEKPDEGGTDLLLMTSDNDT